MFCYSITTSLFIQFDKHLVKFTPVNQNERFETAQCLPIGVACQWEMRQESNVPIRVEGGGCKLIEF